ncbi:MAG: hypothetical protein Q9166_004147 [cf. Caloplaca sp. 2 TL-2023]
MSTNTTAYIEYNDLPSLQTAIRSLDNSKAESVINTEILDAFTRHRASQKFGIQLLHRHFHLPDSDILLEDHTVTSPFPKPTPNAFPADRIIPKSWFFSSNGILTPYEYRIVLSAAEKNASTDVIAHAAFTAEIYEILAKHDLLQILGLSALSSRHNRVRRITDTVMFEKTFNDRNIFFEVGADEIGRSKKSIQTSLWVFIQDDEEARGDNGVAAPATAVSKLLCISGCMCNRAEEEEDVEEDY